MAAEDVEQPWDDQTDQFIDAIDQMNSQQKLSTVPLREMMLNPSNYMDKEGASKTIENLQALVAEYFKAAVEGMPEEKKELDQYLANTDVYYSKIESVISSKSAAARVPYIQPYFVYTNQDEREEILIDEYNESLDLLVGKLTNVSNYIANLSSSYREHKFGSWLFSANKPYVLTIRAPTSIIIDMDKSMGTINEILSSLATSAKSAQKA